MSKFKSIIIIFPISILFFFILCCSNNAEQLNYEENIKKYTELLKKEPNNCLYIEQIANSYQALNNFDQAIKYYKKAIKYCSDNLLNRFQLGVCHYLMMEREVGITFMDEAIEEARKVGDNDFVAMFQKEKKSWLEKWDLVKEFEWNKEKDK
jgi:tetratricopeptide (TPR) repeat protein